VSRIDPSFDAYLEAALAAPEPWERPLDEQRAALAGFCAELWGPADQVAEIRDVALDGRDGLRLRIYRPAGHEQLPGLVWLHGGGWVFGSLDTHDPVCRAFAARGPCVVVSVDYRLAPEHPFPAAADDAWAALRWAADNATSLGIDLGALAVGGDSAGGNLAAVAALRARDAGLGLALQALVYPVIEADFESASYAEYGDALNLSRARMRWYWQQYAGGADPRDPRMAPLHADPAGVAPALVQLAEFDVLRSEGEAYASHLERAGVPVTCTHYRGMLHGFLQMPATTARATQAVAEILDALALAGATARA
jgi:acetyl esterase